MIILSSILLTELAGLGFSCWEPRDKRLFCPSEDWLKVFGGYLVSIRTPGLGDAWDCDDYAMQAVTEASLSCRASARDTGHTFAYCTVRLWADLNGVNPSEGQIDVHACNLVKLNTGQLVFFEPQNGKYCDAKKTIADGIVVPMRVLV